EYLGHKHIDTKKYEEKQVIIADGNTKLFGALVTPLNARGLVLFAHGGGSSHSSPRNQFVAKALNDAGIATLLFDLLTLEEAEDRKNIFDIELMTNRLIMATRWAKKICSGLPIGYFGANTGAAAALGAAAKFIDTFAVVSRGGRPDLAIDSLSQVMAPVLLLVGTEDKSVVPLNESAQNEIKNCKTVLIPGAGHLFEEKGALEEVVEYATSWFSHHLDKKVEVKEKPQENIVEEIEDRSFVFKSVNDLDDWIDQLALHRIVMLGESTHGTKEYYEMRREISKRLIEDHGFSFVAVEGDWPDCFKLNEHIHSKNPETAKNILQNEFHRWPSWMWANEEIHPLIEWMKANKAGGFYGLDVYSLFDSIVSVKRHLKHLDPAISRKIAEGYSCLENFEGNETRYAKSLLTLPKGCQEEVVTNLRHLLRIRLDETILTKSQLFDIKQNARVINNAEKYYRAMLGGGEESWNVRDMHMMETLENLLNLHGPNSKAIVWAHNTHIGDYHATDMLDNGYINIGGLARERFGIENVYLVGFGSHHGEVTAGSAWGRPEQKMKLPNAQVGSYEDYFHKACLHMKADRLLTPLTDLPKGSPLYRRLGHRAVGVVYDPNHERSNYVPTKLANRYDAFMFIDETHALTSIHTIPSIGEFPETWPLGQ
ncbi:MAG: erythromycin esterase family protein, partial [Bacteriovorax sp.]